MEHGLDKALWFPWSLGLRSSCIRAPSRRDDGELYAHDMEHWSWHVDCIKKGKKKWNSLAIIACTQLQLGHYVACVLLSRSLSNELAPFTKICKKRRWRKTRKKFTFRRANSYNFIGNCRVELNESNEPLTLSFEPLN